MTPVIQKLIISSTYIFEGSGQENIWLRSQVIRKQIMVWPGELKREKSLKQPSTLILDNEEFIFNFSQLVPGKTFTLEKSTDLKKWTSVHTFKAKKINENFSDPIDKSEPLFFYRLNWNPMD